MSQCLFTQVGGLKRRTLSEILPVRVILWQDPRGNWLLRSAGAGQKDEKAERRMGRKVNELIIGLAAATWHKY